MTKQRDQSVTKTMLVTGGSGFFGQAFVRRALADGAERVCIYSRGEWAQAQMRTDDSRLRFFIGDVRDRQRLTRAMDGCELVVHAAALKRVEVGQYNPSELVLTNVLGTENVIQAATDAGVGKVVFLSSDKAFEPANAYGCSKAMGEHLVLGAQNTRGKSGPLFAVTRYGNVAGSTGSVIPVWRSIKAKGGMAKLTDPHATRFWMTRDQAVDLVTNTVTTMKGGELVIPDLPAYRLQDLAKAMEVRYEITGLLPGEKAHEGMATGKTSDKARRMSVEELTEALEHV